MGRNENLKFWWFFEHLTVLCIISRSSHTDSLKLFKEKQMYRLVFKITSVTITFWDALVNGWSYCVSYAFIFFIISNMISYLLIFDLTKIKSLIFTVHIMEYLESIKWKRFPVMFFPKKTGFNFLQSVSLKICSFIILPKKPQKSHF